MGAPDKPTGLSRIEALIRRCERASGADQTLDRDIWLAVVATAHERALVMAGRELHGAKEASFRIDWMADGARYTGSLDAAMSLVPEGWSVQFGRGWRCDIERGKSWASVMDVQYGPPTVSGECENVATPALALCVAALRARSALTEQGEG